MSAHTPGPWNVTEAIANDYPLRQMRSLHCRSMVLAHINENYDGEANARLIAAAPELLAALIRAVELLKIHGANVDEHEPILAAIAKAVQS